MAHDWTALVAHVIFILCYYYSVVYILKNYISIKDRDNKAFKKNKLPLPRIQAVMVVNKRINIIYNLQNLLVPKRAATSKSFAYYGWFIYYK